jgi:hypothetical protein
VSTVTNKFSVAVVLAVVRTAKPFRSEILRSSKLTIFRKVARTIHIHHAFIDHLG